MKIYYAEHGFHEETEPRVHVKQDGNGNDRPLVHHVYHSPDGHSWGYMGSGPAELARDILWDLLGAEPLPAIYQKFKGDFIAPLAQDMGFTITEQSIRDWIMAYGFAPERMIVQRSTV